MAASTCGQLGVLDICSRYFGDAFPQHILSAQFYRAAVSGDVESVSMLLKKGAAPDSAYIYGRTPLWIAAAEGHLEVVKTLLETGKVNVNSKSIKGRSPIFWPAADGFEEMVVLLLDAGADPNFIDEDGKTATSVARERGRHHIVRLLDEKNIDL